MTKPFKKSAYATMCLALIGAVATGLFSCHKNSPTDTTVQSMVYVNVTQNTPGCPLVIGFTGPTTYQDDLQALPRHNYSIGSGLVVGNYTLSFNGVSDGVEHSFSSSETITCAPSSSVGCPGWTYSVTP